MEVTITTFSFAAICIAFLYIYKILVQSKPRLLHLPPSGPFSLPVIGHLLHILNPPLHRTLANIAARHGPILLLHFGARPILVVSSPEIAEECFTKNDIIFANRPLDDNAKYLSYNYTTLGSTPYGSHWRNLRRITNTELFTPARIAALSSIRAKEVRYLVRNLSTYPGLVELKPKLTEMLLNIVMQPLAGKRYYEEGINTTGLEKGGRILHIVDEIFRLSEVSNPDDLLPFLKWLGIRRPGHRKQLVMVEKEMDEIFQEMVDERRRQQEAMEREEESKTVIDVMLSLQEKEPEYYTDIVIKGVIMTLLTGSIEPTSGTMEWAMSLLLNNPDSLEKLIVEIGTQVGHDCLVADSDLPNLPYLNNVIKETLRLFPVAPFLIPHCSSSDCKLSGYDIPAGTTLFVNVYAMNRDPSIWSEPTRFKPERFEAGEGGGYRFIPFGSGRRRCPGDTLAARVMGLTLATLIQCFEWDRAGDMEIDLTEAGTITMHKVIPLQAMCKPRAEMINILSQL